MPSTIFITGSSDGLGRMVAGLLVERGHDVILHARNERRAADATRAVPGARACVIGNVDSLAGNLAIAKQVNELGPCDVVVHNAAVGYRERTRLLTPDGLPHVFAINTLSPYVLTASIARPKRLIYMSSGLSHSAGTALDDLLWERRRWDGTAAYAESKFHDILLAFAVARRWPGVLSNALEPGWVPTKMGGAGAPDDLSLAHLTQVMLAVGTDDLATRTGEYFFHERLRAPNPATRDVAKQDLLLRRCAEISGIALPA